MTNFVLDEIAAILDWVAKLGGEDDAARLALCALRLRAGNHSAGESSAGPLLESATLLPS